MLMIGSNQHQIFFSLLTKPFQNSGADKSGASQQHYFFRHAHSPHPLVMGILRPEPKARSVILIPTAACWRLYSFLSTIFITLETMFLSKPIAMISSLLRSFSTYACNIGSSISYGGKESLSFWFSRSSADGSLTRLASGIQA